MNHPRPWIVVQHNESSPRLFRKGPQLSFKPVEIQDAKGEKVLHVGQNDDALPLAYLLVAAVNQLRSDHEILR